MFNVGFLIFLFFFNRVYYRCITLTLMSVKTTGLEQIESVTNICHFTRKTQTVFITRFPLLAAARALKLLRTAPSTWSKFSGFYTEAHGNPNQVIHLH